MLSYQKLSWHCMDDPHNPCRLLPDNFIVQKKCFKMCLKCSPLSQVPLCSNHQVSYTKSNLKHLAISMPKDFMIHPLLTEKRISLLVTATLGHSVGDANGPEKWQSFGTFFPANFLLMKIFENHETSGIGLLLL